jgi:hypothetical protein
MTVGPTTWIDAPSQGQAALERPDHAFNERMLPEGSESVSIPTPKRNEDKAM